MTMPDPAVGTTANVARCYDHPLDGTEIAHLDAWWRDLG
jgi:hypothetical protein